MKVRNFAQCIPAKMKFLKMARLERFELPTHCLEGSCSIQLSYWRILKKLLMERVMGIEPTQSAWKAEILAIELHPQVLTQPSQLDDYIIKTNDCQ